MKKKKIILFILLIYLNSHNITMASEINTNDNTKIFSEYFFTELNINDKFFLMTTDFSKENKFISQKMTINSIWKIRKKNQFLSRFNILNKILSQNENKIINVEYNLNSDYTYKNIEKFNIDYLQPINLNPIYYKNITKPKKIIHYYLTNLFNLKLIEEINQKDINKFEFFLEKFNKKNSFSNISHILYSEIDKNGSSVIQIPPITTCNQITIQNISNIGYGCLGLQVLYEIFENFFQKNNSNIFQKIGRFFHKANIYEFSPFFQTKLGNLDLDAKLNITLGKVLNNKNNIFYNVKCLSTYGNLKLNIQSSKIGLMLTYITCQKKDDKSNLNILPSEETDLKPTLIIDNCLFKKLFFNNFYQNIRNHLEINYFFNEKDYIQNAQLYQLFNTIQITKKLNFKSVYSYIFANRIPLIPIKNFNFYIGNELDIITLYQINPLIHYISGIGFFWPGNCYLLFSQLNFKF